MEKEINKLHQLYAVVIAIKAISIKIDEMKKERERLIDEFKRIQLDDNKLKESYWSRYFDCSNLITKATELAAFVTIN